METIIVGIPCDHFNKNKIKHMKLFHEHKNLLAGGLFLICIFIFSSCAKESFTDENSCDLKNTTYNGDIKKIINGNCAYAGCHSRNIETFDFTTYEGVKTSAGSIINRINRDIEDPLFMPQNKFELNPCDLQKLRTWVSRGAPLN